MGKEGKKEVLKIGSWEDGKRGILPVCLRQGFLGIYHLGIWNLFLITWNLLLGTCFLVLGHIRFLYMEYTAEDVFENIGIFFLDFF